MEEKEESDCVSEWVSEWKGDKTFLPFFAYKNY